MHLQDSLCNFIEFFSLFLNLLTAITPNVSFFNICHALVYQMFQNYFNLQFSCKRCSSKLVEKLFYLLFEFLSISSSIFILNAVLFICNECFVKFSQLSERNLSLNWNQRIFIRIE